VCKRSGQEGGEERGKGDVCTVCSEEGGEGFDVEEEDEIGSGDVC